jgi:hypothetical protein
MEPGRQVGAVWQFGFICVCLDHFGFMFFTGCKSCAFVA